MSSVIPSDLIAPFLLSQRGSNDAASAMDWTWKETPNSHIFKFILPGYSKSDLIINIHPDTRILHITTKTDNTNRDADVDVGVTWHCKERVEISGKISKQFRLPKDGRIDGISASMKDGVLVVTVPKECSFDDSGKVLEEVKKRRSVEIEAKDDRRGGKGGGGMLGSCFMCFKS